MERRFLTVQGEIGENHFFVHNYPIIARLLINATCKLFYVKRSFHWCMGLWGCCIWLLSNFERSKKQLFLIESDSFRFPQKRKWPNRCSSIESIVLKNRFHLRVSPTSSGGIIMSRPTTPRPVSKKREGWQIETFPKTSQALQVYPATKYLLL